MKSQPKRDPALKHFPRMRRKLKGRGYTLKEALWYHDGVYTVENRRSNQLSSYPSHEPSTGFDWEPRWFFSKKEKIGEVEYGFRLKLAFLYESTTYPIMGLSVHLADPSARHELHNRERFFGPLMDLNVVSILEEDLINLDYFEMICQKALDVTLRLSQQLRAGTSGGPPWGGSDLRDGNWIDKWGACKVCDGEIPYGHSEKCDIYKLEKEVREAKRELAELQKKILGRP